MEQVLSPLDQPTSVLFVSPRVPVLASGKEQNLGVYSSDETTCSEYCRMSE